MTSLGSIPSDSLKDKVALVTGAASGIGQASAEVLASAGAKVALVDWSSDKLQQVASEIKNGGGETLAIQTDISDAVAVSAAYEKAISAFGRLDIVVANAGINGVWAPLEKITAHEWDHTLAVNLRGAFLTLKEAIPHLRTRGGSVVVISSVNGSRVFNNLGATAYSCSKAAQVALVKMAALELAPDRIRVNVICPGSISTNIDSSTIRRSLDGKRDQPPSPIPLAPGAPGSPRSIAELVWFLASDLSSHITGSETFVDGAESLR